MTFSSGSIEKQIKEFLENSFGADDYFLDSRVQKKRFGLLSKLVADLFNCKNSRICFQNVSNLIILILYIYNEKFPVDIYSNDKIRKTKKLNSKLKQILKENLL
ncbi:MAG: hypothetical protein ACFFG0_30220 [Candidatus Thorarchaeota archaeon]